MKIVVATKDSDAVFAACDAQGDVMDRAACASPKATREGFAVLSLCVSREPEWPPGTMILSSDGFAKMRSDFQMEVGLVAVKEDAVGLVPVEAMKKPTVLKPSADKDDVVVAAGLPWVEFQGAGV